MGQFGRESTATAGTSIGIIGGRIGLLVWVPIRAWSYGGTALRASVEGANSRGLAKFISVDALVAGRATGHHRYSWHVVGDRYSKRCQLSDTRYSQLIGAIAGRNCRHVRPVHSGVRIAADRTPCRRP